MKLDKLKEFIEFMDANSLCELEVEEGGTKIRLKKNTGDQPVVISQVGAPAAAIQHGIPEQKTDSSRDGLIEIKSPMVGTFYRSPSPESASFVDTGKAIKSGDVTCIIEAMKLMNEIKTEVSGKVVQIMVENGEPVEFGQVLFLVEP